MSEKLAGVSVLDAQDHQLDLHAIASNPISLSQIGGTLSSYQKQYVLSKLRLSGLIDTDNLPAIASFLIEKVEALTDQEAVAILLEAIENHDGDVNIPTSVYEFWESLVGYAPPYSTQSSSSVQDFEDEKKVKDYHNSTQSVSSLEGGSIDTETNEIIDFSIQARTEAVLIAYHSPYREVRAVCDPFDDPAVPVETFRVYVLGLIWTAVGTFINQFFAERQPSIFLTTSVVQLLLYPSGLLTAYIFPKWKFKIWKYTVDLNPGPWSHKEQMLATIFFSVSQGYSYVSFNIHAQKVKIFYNNQWANFGYQTLLILSTNFMGFGFAGIMRKFAVYPVRALWPTVLPVLALNKALTQPERKENINGWTISRYNFFFLVFTISFLYFWLPSFLFQALSIFNWITWIAPTNANVATVTGSMTGLGLNPIPSFDWSVLSWNFALIIPFYSQANQYIGSVIALCAILGVYYSNYKWTAYIPINSSRLFNNQGEYYDVSAVLNEKSLFDKDKYELAGPPYYSAANLVAIGAFFAIYPFAFVYEIASNFRPMWSALKSLGASLKNIRKSTYHGFQDPHTIMMKRYKEVPDWVFLVVLVIAIVLAILCVQLYPAETPVWGIFFAVALNFIFLIPLTTLYATTGFTFGLDVLVELIIGYAIPGNGLALSFIKALGYNINGQAQSYVSDQKLGHYAKIPPRAIFRTQILSVFVHSFIGLAVMNFEIDHIKDYCDPLNKQKFTCPNSSVFFTASVFWGVIGPKKVFGGIYPLLQYCFLIGFILALVCIAIKKYGPKKFTKHFQPTLIIGGMLIYAPYNLSYFTGSLYLSFASMYYLRKKLPAFWEKYNYVFSGAATAGVAFSAIIIFFSVQYQARSLLWWGNTVSFLGLDGTDFALKNATISAPDGYFGLREGHYP